MSSIRAHHHSEWLALVDIRGPFLTVPVLAKSLPYGLDVVSPDLAREVTRSYEAWQADPSTIGSAFAWARWVLTGLLGFDDHVLVEGRAVPAALNHRVAEHGVVLRPDIAVFEPTAAPDGGRRPRLLINVWPARTPLDEQIQGSTWAASPQDLMAELLRVKEARVGLVTNGEQWTLVSATKDASNGFATWDAAVWLDDRVALHAFFTLLRANRFFEVSEEDTLEAMLAESARAQQDVADQLSLQVRRAVETLVDAFSRASRETGGDLLADVDPNELYEAAVTVMMRLIFLLAAEERGLGLLGEEVYDASYAVTPLRAHLQQESYRHGEEPMERRSAAWHRLIAAFRRVHGGFQSKGMHLPVYGGELFDPDRFPFLEGRQRGESWLETSGDPVFVDDRTVLHVLDSLQVLRPHGRGSPHGPHRLSYRALDVEQIGQMFDGLLDWSAVKADEATLGLDGKFEAKVALRAVEGMQQSHGEGAFVKWLADHSGRTPRALTKALAIKLEPDVWNRLLRACDGDMELAERIVPLHGLLRRDLRGLPAVYLPGRVYLTAGFEQRGTVTYNTPRALAEELVEHTLGPLVYKPGPAEGAHPDEWKLKPADELLRLKVCDVAMGSGAFLVSACRYLADCLVRAWSEVERRGETATGPDGRPVPADTEERVLIARRLVADRCVYGVDKNSMAVSMAKLSMWLITLAKDRPFTFLDHALRQGDSLLGISSLDQLINFHPDPRQGRELHSRLQLQDHITAAINRTMGHVVETRRSMESFTVNNIYDAEGKQYLFAETEMAREPLLIVADVLVGATLSAPNDDILDGRLVNVARTVQAALDQKRPEKDRQVALSELKAQAAKWLQQKQLSPQHEHHCFHWPLEFPEVFIGGRFGLDAVVGNPPFLGAMKLGGVVGADYRRWLIRRTASGRRGSADLVAYFFLKTGQLVAKGGRLGLLASNAISRGDTRRIGLDSLVDTGWIITRAVRDRPWPGSENLNVSALWMQKGGWDGQRVLDTVTVAKISPSLAGERKPPRAAHRLRVNAGKCFQGSTVVGAGFFLEAAEAARLIKRDSSYGEVVVPYLTPEDLNSTPEHTPSRWVINFYGWSLEQAEEYPYCLDIIRTKVKPQRDKSKQSAWRERWWQFAERPLELYGAIDGLDRVMAMPIVAKSPIPAFVPSSTVYARGLVVFVYDDDARFGILTTAFHTWWASRWSSRLRMESRYTPAGCFETFPQPSRTDGIAEVGRRLDEYRRALMLERQEGLAKVYNRLHNPAETASDIAELRQLHVELDHVVAGAYGWSDLALDHGFQETWQGSQYTLGPAVRTEVLDRLLELNHERHAEEARLGLQDDA